LYAVLHKGEIKGESRIAYLL